MHAERTRRAGRLSKSGLPGVFAGLMFAALIAGPSAFAVCTNPNPNPNPNPAALAATGDFNADCKSDVLWQHGISGQVAIWLMNGTGTAGTGTIGSVSSPWSIVGVGDFDGNGASDLLWRNSSNGQAAIWFMNGTTVASTAVIGTVATNWSILGVGDFNGDGKSDILWQNSNNGQLAIWLMNGTSQAGSGIVATLAAGWSLVGIGDFDGDGKADLLWQKSANGQTAVWLMNGTSIANSGVVATTVAAAWTVQGVGDFDGDGKSDILWRNITSGQSAIWFMNGTALGTSATLQTVAPDQSTQCCSGVGNGWSIVGVGDYNGDGKADIAWRNLNNGQTAIWLMNGAALSNSGIIGTVAAPWQLAALAPYGCSSQALCNIVSGINGVRANGSYGPGNPTPSQTAGGRLNPMGWDPGAASVARNWAAACNFAHNANRDGGENIYASIGAPITGTDAASSWNSEAANYTYSTNSCSAGNSCGHYTQDVWRTTNRVGCAIQVCPGGGAGDPFGTTDPWNFVVCDFTPPGNWGGVSPY